MKLWIILGLLGIIGTELSKYQKGEKIIINGRKIFQYIGMLLLGAGTLLYGIYKLFSADPVVLSKEDDAASAEE